MGVYVYTYARLRMRVCICANLLSHLDVWALHSTWRMKLSTSLEFTLHMGTQAHPPANMRARRLRYLHHLCNNHPNCNTDTATLCICKYETTHMYTRLWACACAYACAYACGMWNVECGMLMPGMCIPSCAAHAMGMQWTSARMHVAYECVRTYANMHTHTYTYTRTHLHAHSHAHANMQG